MPLTPARCTNCGGAIEVDSTKDAAICPLCGTPYIVEQAINNYNTTNNYTTVNNISADTVQLTTEREFEIRGGNLVRYNGSSCNVVIPEGVKTIADNAFEGCTEIESVTFPSTFQSVRHEPDWNDDIADDSSEHLSVFSGDILSKTCIFHFSPQTTRIPDDLFINCNLSTINLPEGITEIGERTFAKCRFLKTVALPTSLKIIDYSAFCDCLHLEKISLPEGLQEIRGSAFAGCRSLDVKTFPKSLSVIGDFAFSRCHLESLVYPINTQIGDDAFSNNEHLETVVFPEGVTDIAVGALEECPIKELSFPESLKSLA